MHKVRKVIVVASLAALAVTAFAAPASAIIGKGTIGVVNGVPGQRVDICINGKEIRSNVKYGGRTFKTMWEGTKTLKVFKADPRKCKGVKLVKKTIALGAGHDFTVVVNKQFPRAVMFDSTGLGAIPPDGPPLPSAAFAWRHAADLGAVNMFFQQPAPIGPSANPVWSEGDQFVIASWAPGFGMQIFATRPEHLKILAKSPAPFFEAGRRYEYYLLGSKGKNAKIIVWSRAISQPVP